MSLSNDSNDGSKVGCYLYVIELCAHVFRMQGAMDHLS